MNMGTGMGMGMKEEEGYNGEDVVEATEETTTTSSRVAQVLYEQIAMLQLATQF